MSAVDDYVKNNKKYALTHVGGRPVRPTRQVAVVACMDSRMKIFPMLGMGDGEAHVIRNAGGVVTDDVVRSLAISQRLLGTTEIILIHHTDCGMQKTTEAEFKGAIEAETGIRPPWAVESFGDAEQDVRQSIGRLKASPFIPHKDAITGFVFDVDTGKLNEVMRPTLYEFAGGEEAFGPFAAALHARCLADPELNHPFSHPGQHPEHNQRVAAYLTEAFGGPARYSAECADQAHVVWLHAGNGDMSDLGRRFADCFMLAADDAGWPDDPEFRSAIRAYIDWAVDNVALSHPHDTDVPAGLPLPRWSWTGLQ